MVRCSEFWLGLVDPGLLRDFRCRRAAAEPFWVRSVDRVAGDLMSVVDGGRGAEMNRRRRVPSTFGPQSCPTSQTPKPGVSHVRLTERGRLCST